MNPIKKYTMKEYITNEVDGNYLNEAELIDINKGDNEDDE